MPKYPYSLPTMKLELEFFSESENQLEHSRKGRVNELIDHLKEDGVIHDMGNGAYRADDHSQPKIEAAVDSWLAKNKAQPEKTKDDASKIVKWEVPMNFHQLTIRLLPD